MDVCVRKKSLESFHVWECFGRFPPNTSGEQQRARGRSVVNKKREHRLLAAPSFGFELLISSAAPTIDVPRVTAKTDGEALLHARKKYQQIFAQFLSNMRFDVDE